MAKKAGVFALIHKDTGTAFVEGSKNVDKTYGIIRNKLNSNLLSKKHKQLQRDWNACAGECFEFEILERVDEFELQEVEDKWKNQFEELYNPIPEAESKQWLPELENVDTRQLIGGYLSQLDYELPYASQRNELVQDIFDDGINEAYISSDGFRQKQIKRKSDYRAEQQAWDNGISMIGDYLIKKDAITHDKTFDPDYPLMSKYAEQRNAKKEAEYNDEVQMKTHKEPETDEVILPTDYDLYEPIGELHKSIIALDEYLKNIRPEGNMRKEYYRLKRIRNSLHREMKDVKRVLRRPISFQKIMQGSTQYDLDNLIDLKNPLHLKLMLEMWFELSRREEMRLILGELADVINLAKEFNNIDEIEKEIINVVQQKKPFNKDVSKVTYQVVADMVNEKYKIKKSAQDIGYILRESNRSIPVKLAETYIDEIHFYFEEKGKYCKCSSCGDVKLEHHFGNDSRKKNGKKSICKKCAKKNKKILAS